MDQKNWRNKMQPEWYSDAVKKVISNLPGGYEEAVTWIGKKDGKEKEGTTLDSLFNRLRPEGDQILPLGWAIVLQKAGGSHHVAHAVARASGGYFIPGGEVTEVDNSDINEKLLEAFEQISRYSEVFRDAVKDGVMDESEFGQLKDELYLATVKLQEHLNLGSRVYSPSEKSNARECAAPGVVASCASVSGETNA